MAYSKFSNLLQRLATYKYFLPPDIYERHQFIGSQIPPSADVLDVGGSLSRLDEFSKASKVTTVDIKPPADLIYDGKRIPVKDKSYAVVTSIDVLEHVPKESRKAFINELVRVAKQKVIISAPLGTKVHIDYEKKIYSYYQQKNIDMPYLKEHIGIGLPTSQEIAALTKGLNYQIYYSGDIRLTAFFLKIHNFELKTKGLNYVVFILKLFFNLVINIFICPLLIGKKSSQFTNRFYLLIEGE